jgi:hypothetical protein
MAGRARAKARAAQKQARSQDQNQEQNEDQDSATQKENSMKLVGSITLATPKGDKQIANTLDLGDAPDAPLVQHSLHQMLGQMANMIGLHQGATFRAMSVTSDSESSS